MADGGTKAPVYFQMKDQTGLKSFKKRLINKQHLDKKTGQMHFSQGSLIAFRLHDTNLGDIHSIKLDVDQVLIGIQMNFLAGLFLKIVFFFIFKLFEQC